jgi:glycosyltransferase involved in cell wall biosynthesis
MNSKGEMMVSVFMITYNHEKFIAQALEGILMQKVNFPYEIVIGEDCSTDSTRNIILGYDKNYPGKFKLLLHNKNIGALANQMRVLHACTGKYIALCEGDDFWTDPLKLQKQIDFLETNLDFSICYHRVNYLNIDNEIMVESLNTSEDPQIYSILDLAKHNIMHTCSIVFRDNNIIYSCLLKHKKVSAGDYILHMMNARFGKIKYLPDIMAVYRTGSGIWSQLDKKTILKKWIKVLNVLIKLFADNKEIKKNLKDQKSKTLEKYLSYYKLIKFMYKIKYKIKKIFQT